MYHRVVEPPVGHPQPTWNVSPGRFKSQLSGLLARGYRAWPLRKVLAHHGASQAIPPKTFVVTFDDIYGNVYWNAYPVLRELGIPATVFLATDYLDCETPFPFDDWSAAGSTAVSPRTWLPVTTAQCEEMAASGLIELGAHTHTHADFRGRVDEFRRDLSIAMGLLRTKFSVRNASFAFPYGFGNRREDGPELAQAVEHLGACCALTTENALVGPDDDPFNWGRFAAEEGDSAASLAAKLDGWYSLARRCWHVLRRRDRSHAKHEQSPARRPRTRDRIPGRNEVSCRR